jgi:hypothetical protein
MSYLNVGLKKVLARARVDCGDPIPAGARPITAALNVASAIGGGQTVTTSLTITFTTPITDPDYGIDFTPYCNGAANANNDNTLTWMIRSKTSTGFVLSVRELASVAQNVSVDFQCWSLT